MKSTRILVAMSLLAILTACNTMEGLGQDVQRGGNAIEDAADANK